MAVNHEEMTRTYVIFWPVAWRTVTGIKEATRWIFEKCATQLRQDRVWTS
jgi:hypothetical protein